MSEKEKLIMENFKKTIPKLSDLEQEKLLSFGEGMAYMVDQREQRETGKAKKTDDE
jgi:hypothetical protein